MESRADQYHEAALRLLNDIVIMVRLGLFNDLPSRRSVVRL
ncbi:hypothetical protein [Hymenobacter sp.]